MKCSNCGCEVNDGASFCTNCGSKITRNNENSNVKISMGERKRGSCLPFLILLILIILAGAFCVFKFLPGKELPFGITVPEIKLPFQNIKTNSKKNDVVYYMKNNGLYLLNGKEDQEPITKKVSSDLYYDEKTGYTYFIREGSIYKLKNGEDELVARGDESKQCTTPTLFFGGIVYGYDNRLYLYKDDDKNKICDMRTEGPGSNTVEYDYENNILYVKDINDKLYKVNENLDKELISDEVGSISYVAGMGLFYVTKDDPKTYIYKDGDKEKLYDGELLVTSSRIKKGFVYLHENTTLSGKASGYITNSNTNDIFLEQVMQTAKNVAIDRKYKTLYNYYIYDGKELTLLISNVARRSTVDNYLIVGKTFIKDSSHIDIATIGLNQSNYPNKLIDAINEKFFPTNNLIYYIFKGSEASMIKFDGKEYLPYNVSKTAFSRAVKDDNLKVQLFNENDIKETYEGKISIGNVTNLSKNEDINSKMSVSSEFIRETVDDNTYNLYNEKGTKILFENVVDEYYDGGKYLYAIANYDKNEGTGILYKKNLDNGDKEKIASGVICFLYREVKPTIKVVDGIKTTKFNLDSFNGDKIIDEYIKTNLITGWVNDEKDKAKWYYYKSNHQKAVNEYLEIDGKWYHFDDKGSMDKDKWIEGYYYGEDGTMKTNQWVGEYYVGSDGKFKINSWVGSSYVGADGKKVYNRWVHPYYIGNNGNYVTNTIIDGQNIGPDGRIVVVQTTKPVIIETTSANSSTIIQSEIAPTEINDSNKELYVAGYLSTYKDTFEIEKKYDSTLSLKMPKFAGKDQTEVDVINDLVSDSITNELAELLEERLRSISPAYKSIQITKAEVTTIQKKTIRISLSGTAKKENGNSTNIKYRITYDREEETYELSKIS